MKAAYGNVALAAVLCAAVSGAANATVSRDLAYPAGTPTAEEVAKQIYFVNHFYAVDDFSIGRKGKKKITVIINKSKGERPTTNTVERHLNNNYSGGAVKSKDLAIFRSGKLKGTGMLIVDYSDEAKSQSYSIWLPALRKVRRFAQPAHDDAWGGTDFTFGDVTLRKPNDENHELLGETTMQGCLGTIDMGGQHTRWTGRVKDYMAADCSVQDKQVYRLKSTHKKGNWWYDHRISYVDTKTFADYRTEYFKDGEKIKVIDRAWRPMEGESDPRAMRWGYWYGTTLTTGHETMAVIPEGVASWNTGKKEKFWSERTLRKIKR